MTCTPSSNVRVLSKLLLYSRAELILQEHIEYNDIVKSIEGETNSSLKDDEISSATRNANSKQNHDSAQEDSKGDRGDPNDPCVRMKRDCVGIMAAFRLKDPSDHILIVANTHIYWSIYNSGVRKI